MLKFERDTKDKKYNDSQEKIFQEGENGLVCHMITGQMTFDQIVFSVRKYYEQEPAGTILGWDIVVGKKSDEILNLVKENRIYKEADRIIALAIIRLVENGFVKVIFDA